MAVFNSAIAILLFFKRSKSLSTLGSLNADMTNVAKQATFMLLTVTCVFILLKLPISTYLHIVGNAIRTQPIVIAVVANLAYLNSAVNSILYMFSGSKFRQEALSILKLRNYKKSQSYIDTGFNPKSGTSQFKSQTSSSDLPEMSCSTATTREVHQITSQ